MSGTQSIVVRDVEAHAGTVEAGSALAIDDPDRDRMIRCAKCGHLNLAVALVAAEEPEYTVSQVCKILSMGRSSVMGLIKKKLLRATRLPGGRTARWQISRADLREFRASRVSNVPEEPPR